MTNELRNFDSMKKGYENNLELCYLTFQHTFHAISPHQKKKKKKKNH